MKFAYTILYVQNVARSLEFYEVAFDFKKRFLHDSGQYGELETGATTLAFASYEIAGLNFPSGIQRSNPTGLPAATEIAFSTTDVGAAYLKAVQAGAASFSEPKTKPWGQTVAYVRDLDGHLVELCTPMA